MAGTGSSFFFGNDGGAGSCDCLGDNDGNDDEMDDGEVDSDNAEDDAVEEDKCASQKIMFCKGTNPILFPC